MKQRLGVDEEGRVDQFPPPPPYVIRFRHMLMTPEQAQQIIEKNTHNRKVRKSRVAKYALAMRHGGWKLSHECVAISPDNTIVDGQHRLLAVIEAGVPVWMTVAFDVPMDVQEVIDDGAPRSMADALTLGTSIDGVVDSNTAAIARVVLQFNFRSKAPSRLETIDIMKHCGRQIAFARTLMNGPFTKGIATAPVAGAIAVAAFHEAEERLAEFIGILHNAGLHDTAGDAGAHRLYYTLANAGTGRTRVDRYYTYRLTTRAIKAFANHEPIKQLKAPQEPCYRLPESLTK